jgi:hypothetical protein
MNELNGFQFDMLFGEIYAVELKAGQMRIALSDGFEVRRVQVQPNDARSDAGVDAVESVSAGYSQDRD